jgi:hypothetical protein
MDEKYTWNLTWQHQDKVIKSPGICMKGGLDAIAGGAQEIQIVIGCQILFYYF